MSLEPKQIECLPESVMIFGCGYVGSALARGLISHGVRVGALTRNAAKADELRALGVDEVIEAALDSPAWHQQLKGSYRAVVNCVSSAGGGVAGYRKSYLEGQGRILEWAKGRAIERYLYTSSTSVYPQDGGVCVDESCGTDGAPETGQILLESERMIAEAGERFGRWYVFRLAGIYGPGRHYLLDLLRSGVTDIPGSGAHHLNLIHRDDIVSVMLRALSLGQTAASGVYNLADDSASTKASVVDWLARRIGVAAPHFDSAATSSRLMRRGGRMPDRIILNRKAKEAFAWSPHYPDFRGAYEVLLSQPGRSER